MKLLFILSFILLSVHATDEINESESTNSTSFNEEDIQIWFWISIGVLCFLLIWIIIGLMITIGIHLCKRKNKQNSTYGTI